ncbi:MAG: hypothetical protein ABJG75_20950 [Roseobacter sp.]
MRQLNLGASFDVRYRRRACDKPSMVNACSYCRAHRSVVGQSLGMSADELLALMNDSYQTSALIDAKDKAAILWSAAMTKNSAQRDNKV